LTGEETDRLPEEKERGISIDLGFAGWQLPDGTQVGIVDVPGHERFIKNMVAGVSGIDLALLVIAADEGVMPQTREHLDILSLLGVTQGIVAVTKSDLVAEDWLSLVVEEAREELQGTFLEGAPVVPVSSITGQGLDSLIEAVTGVVKLTRPRPATGLARLPVDRAFSVSGFGTVVTGTLISGRVAVGDELEALPSQQTARVRNLQAHGEDVGQVRAGQRVAVNFAGIPKDSVGRGTILATPGFFQPTDTLTLLFKLLPKADPLEHNTRVRLHLGTRELLGRVIPLESEIVPPGSEGFVRFRSEEGLVAAYGEPFIVRSYSPLRTLGGGVVIDTGRRHRRLSKEAIKHLERLATLEGDELIAYRLAAELQVPATRTELARFLVVDPGQLDTALDALDGEGMLRHFGAKGDLVCHEEVYRRMAETVRGFVKNYIEKHPLRIGPGREEVRQETLPELGPREFALVAMELVESGIVSLMEDRLTTPGHRVSFTQDQEEAVSYIQRRFAAEPFTPPALDDVVADLHLPAQEGRELARYLMQRGELVAINQEIVLARAAIEEAKGAVARHVATAGGITVAELRDLLDTSRKFALPLMEYLDSSGFTLRVGDRRILAKAKA